MKRLKGFLVLCGSAIFVYFAWTLFYWGRYDVISIAASLFGLALIPASLKLEVFTSAFKRAPKILRLSLAGLFGVVALSMMIVLSIVFFHMRDTSTPNADYIIILGCQVEGDTPSIPLMRRINVGAEYLNANPQTLAVAAGGMGPGENITEAQAIKTGLLQNGIREDRVLKEDKSVSTLKNLIFANDLYDLHDKNVVIVTSDYHLFRALSVAKKLGYKNVSGLPAKSSPFMLTAYLLREYITVTAYFVTGRL